MNTRPFLRLLTAALIAGALQLNAEPEKIVYGPPATVGDRIMEAQQLLNQGWTVKRMSLSDVGILFVLKPPVPTPEQIAAKATQDEASGKAARDKQAALVESARLRHEQWVREHRVEKE